MCKREAMAPQLSLYASGGSRRSGGRSAAPVISSAAKMGCVYNVCRNAFLAELKCFFQINELKCYTQ
jgi:hypothetical protein